MANMSYCKFENTYNDLMDCMDSLENNTIEGLESEASIREKPFIRDLIKLCQNIYEEFGE